MIINKKAVKALALDVAGLRHHKFTRIGKEFTDRAEMHLREWIRKEVHSHPSVGKTIK